MSAAYEGLPIFRAATDLVVYLEIIVRGFSRYHKYTIGSEMRILSYAILELITEANTRVYRVENLKAALDDLRRLKVRIQVCSEIKAFRKANNFPTATRKVIDVSKQCEGWLRSCQNPGRHTPLQESANMKSLGAHATGNSGIRKQEAVPRGSASDGPKKR